MTPLTIKDYFVIIPVLFSLFTGIWTIWYNLKRNKTDKINRTIELQQFFYSNDMLEARDKSWDWLDELYKSKDLPPFNKLWKNTGKLEGEKFDRLYKVLAFWHIVSTLGERNQIEKELAAHLFSYEYNNWYDQLKQLVKVSYEKGGEIPDYLFNMKFKIKWLSETGKNHNK